MVAKISTGGNMFGALAYNQNKVDSGEAKVLFSNRMLLSEDGIYWKTSAVTPMQPDCP